MSTLTATASTRYTAADAIQVLEGLEPVRKRPAMYIGGVDAKGLHHLAWEIIDNAVDEYINGFADHIIVTLHKSGDAVTVHHAGGKFGDTESGYLHSGGLHGVGASVVNALSKKLVAQIRRDGFEYR